MDLAKAKQLLEMLRRRTEDRGATAAEAAQAAELAEKIIARYGLDRGGSSDVEHVHVLPEKRFPRWAQILGWAIEERFGCRGSYRWKTGNPSAICFKGPEHLARVSCWLFAAIAKDLEASSRKAAAKHEVAGPQMVKFRNAFKRAACWEVWRRMQRPSERIPGQSTTANDASCTRGRPRRKTPHITLVEALAFEAGMRCGWDISIDTDVIGERGVHAVAGLEGPKRTHPCVGTARPRESG